MYQQWRHLQQNDWFYVYAQNGATSVTNPVWDYYYYAPGRGATRINNVASLAIGGNQTVASGGPNVAAASQVFIGTGTTNPAFH